MILVPTATTANANACYTRYMNEMTNEQQDALRDWIEIECHNALEHDRVKRITGYVPRFW